MTENETTETGGGADDEIQAAAETEPAAKAEPVPANDARPAAEAAAEAKIAELEAEAAGLKDQLLRALAEVENVRRRGEREREDAQRFAIAKFAGALVDVADNLSQALAALPTGGDGANQALRQGVELTERTLMSVFERHGISRFDPTGEPFDPNRHQAVFEVEAADKAAGTVVQALRAGYMINGRLLRPAMVGVAKGGPAPGAETAPPGASIDTTV
jgi:molecular chaperone GrpE